LRGRRLDRFPSTLLHGDAKLENLGLGSSGLVAIDWGDLTGFGPPEIDVAWYALQGKDGRPPALIISASWARTRCSGDSRSASKARSTGSWL